MKDKFENNIKLVSGIYPEEVPADSWNAIKSKLKLKSGDKKKTPKFNYWKAASIILFIGSVMLLYIMRFAPGGVNNNGLSSISNHYKKMEKEYQADVAQVSEEIDLNEVDRKMFKDFFEEMHTLDSLNDSYKNDLKSIAKKEKLVPILIDYYEKKLRLLRKLELEINRKKHEESNQITI